MKRSNSKIDTKEVELDEDEMDEEDDDDDDEEDFDDDEEEEEEEDETDDEYEPDRDKIIDDDDDDDYEEFGNGRNKSSKTKGIKMGDMFKYCDPLSLYICGAIGTLMKPSTDAKSIWDKLTSDTKKLMAIFEEKKNIYNQYDEYIMSSAELTQWVVLLYVYLEHVRLSDSSRFPTKYQQNPFVKSPLHRYKNSDKEGGSVLELFNAKFRKKAVRSDVMNVHDDFCKLFSYIRDSLDYNDANHMPGLFSDFEITNYLNTIVVLFSKRNQPNDTIKLLVILFFFNYYNWDTNQSPETTYSEFCKILYTRLTQLYLLMILNHKDLNKTYDSIMPVEFKEGQHILDDNTSNLLERVTPDFSSVKHGIPRHNGIYLFWDITYGEKQVFPRGICVFRPSIKIPNINEIIQNHMYTPLSLDMNSISFSRDVLLYPHKNWVQILTNTEDTIGWYDLISQMCTERMI